MSNKYFLIPAKYQDPEHAKYEHNMMAIVEGLQEMNIDYYASANYWPLIDGSFYIKEYLPENNDFFTIVSHELYPQFDNINFQNTIYLDAADGWRTTSTDQNFFQFKYILRTHYNNHYKYPPNCHPWTFGLTNRIINATQNSMNWSNRGDVILFNFRVGHPLRDFVATHIMPEIKKKYILDKKTDSLTCTKNTQDYLFWASTGRRHYPSYYNRLKSIKFCAAFGGYFSANISCNLNSFFERTAYKVVFKSKMITNTVMQWDSWRLWEAWAAGTVVLHIDFDKYGCQFPVQPENWKHYVGFDLKNLKNDIERFLSLSDDQLQAIAENGQQWALTNYSPIAVTKRLNSLLNNYE